MLFRSEDERAILCNISREIERQARFQSALGAIRLHHAIAACQAGLTLQRELDAFVLEQLEVQEELIEKGGTVDDPTALERAKLESADIQLKLDCQLRKLRNELSLLIGPETACSYTSELVTTPTPTLEEPCDLQSLALANRIELKLTRYLRHHVDRLGKDGLKQASELLKLPADLKIGRAHV